MTIDDPVLALVVKHIDGVKDHMSSEIDGVKTIVTSKIENVEEKVDRLDREGCQQFAAHRVLVDGTSRSAPSALSAGFKDWHPATKAVTVAGGGYVAIAMAFEFGSKVIDWLASLVK